MRASRFFMPTLREVPSDAEVISHQLMLKGGFVRKLASGIYNYLPLGLRVIKKIENIVREEMNAAGAQEVLLPIVIPSELWKETGRWQEYGKELLRFKDRHENEFCMGPTHEEVITDLVRKNVSSYRQLPLALYQIQTKFRDEVRPRFGLMRGREFIMKDCYSFDKNEEEAKKSYWRYHEAYKKIFVKCGLKFKAVEAGTGLIGGDLSHEFQVLANSGEDAIVSCNACEYAANVEKAESKEGENCARCKKGKMEPHRGIEVGQVFYLGTKYSKSLSATFLNEQGKDELMVMGCYGIGIGRTAAAAIEQNHDDKGIKWPASIAPFSACVISLGVDSKVAEAAEKFYLTLVGKGVDVLMDDRDERAGVKFNDADLIGIPFQVTVGSRGLEKNEVEIKDRRLGTKESVSLDQALNLLTFKLQLR
ncbi:MAG: proline--tRNA ligase [Deltaproteobacteria bacterium]|nr:proline--tRNA ligase [Deltaproteobacteria bacterium]